MANENKFKLASYGNEQLIKDAGSLSLFTPQGNPDEVDQIVDTQVNIQYGKLKRVPGINVLTYMIVPGLSTDGSSSLNMACKKLYTFVRHANSGSRNYDSPDLMNFAFSGVSLFTFIAQAQRAYGVIRNWKGKNRYFGKYLTQALGWDYTDLEGKLADFRAAINLAVAKLNAIKIPAAWPFWGKNWILNSVLLKDGDIDRSQVYAFRSNNIWKYNETGTYIGSLTPEWLFGNTESNLIDLSDFNLYVDTIINAFVASEDINIMSGDVMKAYGEDNCLELPYLAEDYIVEPVYNREMLEVIHNATPYEVSKTYSTTAGCIIHQDSNNALLFDPIIPLNQVGYSDVIDPDKEIQVEGAAIEREYLDFFRDDVVPGDVVSASIMTTIPIAVRDQSGYYTYGQFVNFGTELVVKSQLFCLKDDGSGFETIVPAQRRYFTKSQNFTLPALGIISSVISRFDWHNRTAFFIYPDNKNDYQDNLQQEVHALYDLYNYTVVSNVELGKLHDVHVLGGFGLLD